ncbi:MAG TPA: hypothetical protein DCY93_01040, partial [Firmicutes bacterium]|nr:hypothetical protein [Bacillota bacterium]
IIIETNSKSIDTLVILAKNNIEIINELYSLQEKLKYLAPSDKSKIFERDKKIGDKLDDLKVILTKSEGEFNKKVKDTLFDIQIAISERNKRLHSI